MKNFFERISNLSLKITQLSDKDRKDIISGMIFLAIGTLILLSLASRPLARNYVGVIGWYLARGLFRAFGKVAFIIPIMFYISTIARFVHRPRGSFWRGRITWVFLVVILCMLLRVARPYHQQGGWLGGFLSHGSMNIFGMVGSYIIISVSLVILVFVVTHKQKKEISAERQTISKKGIMPGEQVRDLFVCTACGYVGKRDRIKKGNLLVEIFLWLFFLVPGLIYSVWRLSSKYDVCPNCKKPSLIPASSPMGRKLIEENFPKTKNSTTTFSNTGR